MRISGHFLKISGLALLTLMAGHATGQNVNNDDSLALVALYNQCNGLNWTRQANWLTGTADTWEGITVENGRVVEILLGGDPTVGLSGPPPTELQNLDMLRSINFHNNQLTGPPPAVWSALTNLKSINLDNNLFNGQLPDSWSALTNLEQILIGGNQLTGSLPHSWSALTKLKALSLTHNQLTGSLPATWSSLVNLYSLDLGTNSLSGELPASWSSMTGLGILTLGPNQLTGMLPASWSGLKNLWVAYFGYNQMEGSLPSSWSALTLLTDLVISNNRLTGLEDITGMTSLESLEAENNKLDFGDIEPAIGVAKNVFNYVPQDPVGTAKTTYKAPGESFRTSVKVGGQYNHYQWYKGTTPIPSATDSALVIASVSTGDKGVYSCRITNTLVTDLTLESLPDTLVIIDPDVDRPQVTTTEIGSITETTAKGGGVVTTDGGSAVTSRGICWSTSQDPTVTDNRTVNGSGTGTFVSDLTGLNPNTTYHVRAYATSLRGTGYGQEVTFTTLASLPEVSTATITEIQQSTAAGGGEVTRQGGAPVTARGICWSTRTDPTLADEKTTDGSGTGTFTSRMTGLTRNTAYFVRAYATNSYGTRYGNQVTFVTIDTVLLPTIITAAITDISETTARSGGNITSDGGADVTARGVCWSTSPNPTLGNPFTTDGSGTGTFESNLSGLTGNTTYYVRAYAKNSAGTGYGPEVTFTTAAILASVTTVEISTITTTTATGGGIVVSDGGAEISARGICWSSVPNPTLQNSHTNDGTVTGTFTSQLSGLAPNTTYYVRAYATNSMGTNFGNQVTFATLRGIDAPVVTTAAMSIVTETTANTGGDVTSDGGSPVTGRGVCWSITLNPTTADSLTTDGSGTGPFISHVIGLKANTTYYLRAYAINEVGTSYGEKLAFTTLTGMPQVTTAPISEISQTDALGGGEVTGDGGAPITARGICWATRTNPSLTDNKTIDGTGNGNFISHLNGLTSNRRYYVRAYATNSAGTSYGDQIQFMTLPNVRIPVLTTLEINSIGQTTAIGGGNITSDGGSPVVSRGICWSTATDPTIDDYRSEEGSGTGIFTSTLSGLTGNTTYHVRAYATNSAGVSYGQDMAFNTAPLSPSVNTADIIDITDISATGGGDVISDGGSAITGRGICWSVNPSPNLSDNFSEAGFGTGTFTSILTGLTESTTYHARAYATNSAGTTYGNETVFTTLSTTRLPMVTTAPISAILQESASGGGDVLSDGSSPVTARGICWSKVSNPTISDDLTIDGAGIGPFSSSLADLTENTTYHVRAYATNHLGTAYGAEVSFTTLASLMSPAVNTLPVSSITPNSAVAGGEVTFDGGTEVLARGVCWSTASNPDLSGSYVTSGSGTGIFTSQLEGLIENTTYYVRAYATNSVGTTFGQQVTFTTSYIISIPSVNTADVTAITESTALSGGTVTLDGGSEITVRGVCWSKSPNPNIEVDARTENGTGSGSFSSLVTGLERNTVYYLRAFAINNAGTGYGQEISFGTLAILPTVQTSEVSDVTRNTATIGGEVTDDGGTSVTDRGICWSVYPAPTLSDQVMSFGPATGPFSGNLTSLTGGTTYYVRAYATNSVGTNYGNEVVFNTLPNPEIPTVFTTAPADITFNSALCGGDITKDGGAPILARGVCWSTNLNPTLADAFTSDGTGTGPFASYLTNLVSNTVYYLRAYATNIAGTSFGSEVSMTTLEDTTGSSENPPVNIYPNPAIGSVNINITMADTTNAQLTVYDINGTVILTESIEVVGTLKLQLDISGWQVGMYVLTLVTDDQVITSRFYVN